MSERIKGLTIFIRLCLWNDRVKKIKTFENFLLFEDEFLEEKKREENKASLTSQATEGFFSLTSKLVTLFKYEFGGTKEEIEDASKLKALENVMNHEKK